MLKFVLVLISCFFISCAKEQVKSAPDWSGADSRADKIHQDFDKELK
jgi:hypothetical protein